MDRFIKDIGSLTRLVDMEDLSMRMVMFTTAIGEIISRMVMEFTLIKMARSMKVNGKKIYNMEKV